MLYYYFYLNFLIFRYLTYMDLRSNQAKSNSSSMLFHVELSWAKLELETNSLSHVEFEREKNNLNFCGTPG
jgi:hypothetical protein